MPNNLEILAYIQCMKDRALSDVTKAVESEQRNLKFYGVGIYRNRLTEIELLEKFIKGGKNNG